MAKANGSDHSELAGVLQSISPPDIHGLETARITEMFESFGYLCKPRGKVRGISGNLHDFDFVCIKRDTGEKLLLDSLIEVKNTDGEMEIEFVKLRLKTYDCSPELCFVVVKSFSSQMKQMATLYRLTIIDGSSDESPYDQMESLLRLRDGDMTIRTHVSK